MLLPQDKASIKLLSAGHIYWSIRMCHLTKINVATKSSFTHMFQHFTVRTFCGRGVNKQQYSLTVWSKLLSAVTYRQRSLQFACDCAEAVQHQVFTHTVDPLAAGRQSATHKVAAFPLTRAETSHNLQRERATHAFKPTQSINMWRQVGGHIYYPSYITKTASNLIKLWTKLSLGIHLFGVYSWLFNKAKL